MTGDYEDNNNTEEDSYDFAGTVYLVTTPLSIASLVRDVFDGVMTVNGSNWFLCL